MQIGLAMGGEYLNQSIVEQMETPDLWAWRQSVADRIGKETVFLAQIDYALEQRGER